MSTISVIGGGHSAGSLKNPPRGVGIVIGVNDSMWRSQCAFGVTMDRLWMENRWAEINRRVGQGTLRHIHARHAALKNIRDRPPWLHGFDNDHTSSQMSDEPGRLNGTNSGLCALNLAFQMRPERITLIGFDMNRGPDGRAYWWQKNAAEPGYPWAKPGGATTGGKYKEWAAQFAQFAQACRRERIQVINASPTSAITEFPKVALASLHAEYAR